MTLTEESQHAVDIGSPIFTPRLCLRRLVRSDADAVIRLRCDPRVFYWRTPDTPEQAVQWLEDRLKDDLCMAYAYELLDQREQCHGDGIIGMGGAHRCPEIGYVFDPSYWHKGYATEALKGFMNFYWKAYPTGHPLLTDTREQNILRAETGPEAAGSRNVLKKCGFLFKGQREERDEKGPVFLDVWIAHRPNA